MIQRTGKIKKNISSNISFLNKAILNYFQKHELFVYLRSVEINRNFILNNKKN